MEISLLAKLSSAGARKAGKLALLCIWLIVAATEVYYILPDSSEYPGIDMLLDPIFADNTNRSLIRNSRGDTIKIEHEFPLGRYDPEHLVVRLRRVHHWISITLLKAGSHGLDYHIKWLDQNTIEVRLVFGCLVRLQTPVTTVGPIHISYRLIDSDRSLGSCLPGVPSHSQPLLERIPENR